MAIKKCDCKNEFMDKKYGKGMRVANKTQRVLNNQPLYRCVVCLKEKV